MEPKSSGTRIGDGLGWIEAESVDLENSDKAIIVTIRRGNMGGSVIAREIATHQMVAHLRIFASTLEKMLTGAAQHVPAGEVDTCA